MYFLICIPKQIECVILDHGFANGWSDTQKDLRSVYSTVYICGIVTLNLKTRKRVKYHATVITHLEF